MLCSLIPQPSFILAHWLKSNIRNTNIEQLRRSFRGNYIRHHEPSPLPTSAALFGSAAHLAGSVLRQQQTLQRTLGLCCPRCQETLGHVGKILLLFPPSSCECRPHDGGWVRRRWDDAVCQANG